MNSNQMIEIESRYDLIKKYNNTNAISELLDEDQLDLILLLLHKKIITPDKICHGIGYSNERHGKLIDCFMKNNEISSFLDHVHYLKDNRQYKPYDDMVKKNIEKYKSKIMLFLETLAKIRFYLFINEIPNDLIPIIVEYIPPNQMDKPIIENYTITPVMKEYIDDFTDEKRSIWREECIKYIVDKSLDQYTNCFKYETGKEL